MERQLCIDISTWQGGINYQDIKNNCNYAILRAGFSETKDNQLENHYNGLQGINLGAYWYSYAKSVDEAKREARKCLEVINGKKFTLPIYLDLEDPSISGLGRSTLDAIVRAFGEEIENAGYYFGVYTNLNWYRNIISGSELNKQYDWWIALWGDDAPSPSYGINYGIWQFGSNLYIGGQRVDGDYIYKDYPTIIREAGLNHLGGDTPAPTPTPTPEPVPEPTPEPPADDLLDLVRRTIRGDFGNGQDRVNALGDRYDEVQRQVNLNLEHGNTQWDSIRLY